MKITLLLHYPTITIFFYDGFDNQLIVSFSGWNHYTELPISNGLAYFLTATLASDFSIGGRHKTNTGCLNDFWWDKRGVDIGMKSSFICNNCLEKTNLSIEETSKAYNDILSLLDLVSTHSRRNQNILNYQIQNTDIRNEEFEIFLCHNSNDKPHVRLINEELKKLQTKTWIDEEQIGLGASWQIELEKQIVSIKNAGVFVGDNGLGPWQIMEIRAFLIEILNNGGRVIPIILPNAKEIPDLPIFLKQFNYLDLRKDYMDGIEKLAETVKSNS